MLQTVTGEELEQILQNNTEDTMLVTFTSAYLGNCRMLNDIIEELSEEFSTHVNCYSIDADTDNDYVANKGIYEVPVTLIYSNSELVFYGQGLFSKSNLRKKLNEFYNKEMT